MDSAWLAANGPAPYYLMTAGATYWLDQDITTSGTAIIFLNDHITLDLNGHTITFGNVSPLTVANGGFESGSSPTDVPGWTLDTPANAQRVAAPIGMWGSWALQLTGITSSTPQVVTSDPITIPTANIEYAALVTPRSDSGVTVSIAVIDTVTDVTLASGNSSNANRGFAAVATFVPTTTNAVKLRITASVTSGTKATDLDFVCLRHSRDYGIIATSSSTGLPTHVRTSTVNANLGKTNTCTIANGHIVQGTGLHYLASGIHAGSLSGLTMTNVSITMSGTDGQHVYGQYATNPSITGCTFTGNLENVVNRMAVVAAVNLSAVNGTVTIDGNTITGIMHCGINCTRSGVVTASIAITNNTITHNSRWTDGYGVRVVGVRNFDISDNTIQPVNGRGILMDSTSDAISHDGTIDGNVVEAREAPNLEYTYFEATALRVRQYTDDAFRNINITNNVFFADTGDNKAWAAIGCRVTLTNDGGLSNNHNVVFENNTFRAVLNSIDPDYTGTYTPRAWGLSFATNVAGLNTIWKNNRFESNDVSLNFGDNDGASVLGVLMVGNTYQKLTPPGAPAMTHRSVVIGDWGTPVNSNSLIDNHYESGATSTLTFLGTTTKDMGVGWLLDVLVTSSGSPVSGATVIVKDKDDTQVFSGTTGADGYVRNIPLTTTIYRQLTTDPNTITTDARGPFAVSASSGALSGSDTVNPSANASMSVPIT